MGKNARARVGRITLKEEYDGDGELYRESHPGNSNLLIQINARNVDFDYLLPELTALRAWTLLVYKRGIPLRMFGTPEQLDLLDWADLETPEAIDRADKIYRLSLGALYDLALEFLAEVDDCPHDDCVAGWERTKEAFMEALSESIALALI